MSTEEERATRDDEREPQGGTESWLTEQIELIALEEGFA
jgi:hypothetical protein